MAIVNNNSTDKSKEIALQLVQNNSNITYLETNNEKGKGVGLKKAIENIELGDLVLAFNKEGELGPASVTETFKHENDQFIKLLHWNGDLTLTPNHWVLLEDGLFLEAGKLIAGEDQLVTEDGKISPIDEIFRSKNIFILII